MAGTLKTTLQVVFTLGLVSAIYSSTWILALSSAGSTHMMMDFAELDEVDDDRFAHVVWTPPTPKAPTETVPEGEPTEAASTTNAVAQNSTTAATEGVATPGTEPNFVTAQLGPVPPPSHAAKRARQRRRVMRPSTKRELSNKQKRVRKRRKRQRERLAKQPKCDALIDQIVPVAEGEWWVGKELAGCYRTHPRQFGRMGGMQWVEDDKDKRVGLKLYLNRKERGDIARAVGFKRGDVLRSLNGVPLRSTVGSSFAVAQLLGGRAKLKFLRKGEEHQVVLRVVSDKKLERARAELENELSVAERK
ncbi:MAG: hypothetical protein AB8H79_15190 [Myxococcota bacterium]